MGNISDALNRAQEERRRRQLPAPGTAGAGRSTVSPAPPQEFLPALETGGRKPFPSIASEAHRGAVVAVDDPILLPSSRGDGGASQGPHVSASTFMRYKWTVLGVFAAVTAVSVSLIWYFSVPVYSASAVVRVSPMVPRILFKTEDNGIVPLYQSYLNTQVSIIRSPQVFQRVLDQPEVRRTGWYQQPSSSLFAGPMSPIERLKNDLTARPRRDTELIDVSMVASDPGDAAMVVNAVVDQYQQLNNESFKETDDFRFQTLVEQRNTLKAELDGLIATKFRISKQLGTATPEEVRSELSRQLSDLEAQLSRLQRDRANLEWELQEIESATPGARSDAATDRARAHEEEQRFADDAEWRQLSRDLETARHKVVIARQRYGESHPVLIELLSNVDLAAKRLGERESGLETSRNTLVVRQQGSPADGGLSGMSGSRSVMPQEIKRLKYHELRLTESVERQREKVSVAGDVAQELAKQDERINQKRQLLQAVQDRIQQLETEGRAPGRISVAAKALPPSKPDGDRRAILTVMAMAAALFAGLGAAYLRSTINPTIVEPVDVTDTVRAPFLGQFPRVRDTAGLMDPLAFVLPEPIRMVRTALLERLPAGSGNVVLITSSGPEAGKTTLAILLARSLGQLGKKVLLVDADFRRPSLSRRFEIQTDYGIIALLGGYCSDAEAIVESDISGIHVLPVGRTLNGYDPELLANGRLSESLRRWRVMYDIILLDGPPVLPVADARMLATQVDGTILTLRASHCKRTDAVETFARLSASGSKLLGTVLVGAPEQLPYGSYYAHQGEAISPASATA